MIACCQKCVWYNRIEAKQTSQRPVYKNSAQTKHPFLDIRFWSLENLLRISLAPHNKKMAGNSITALNIIERIFSNWKALEEIVVIGKVHDFEMMNKVRYFCQSFAIVVSMEDKLEYREICIDLKDLTNMIFNKLLTDNSEKEIAKQIMLFHECKVKNDIESLNAEYQRLPELRKWIIS